MISVLLVDDHEIVRMGLKMIFETLEDYEVVGEANNGAEALRFIESNKVDIILLDLKMPVMDGLTFMKHYASLGITTPVVILTTLNDQECIKRGIGLGAKSYLLKDACRETLVRTLQAAINDEMLLTKELQDKLLLNNINETIQEPMKHFDLTEREIYILSSIAKGDTNRAISIEFGLSERTVKAHLTNIYSKMGVSSRSEAVAKALANKIIHI